MGVGTGKSLNWWRRTALYRLYDDQDALLYIGIGFNPRTRWYRHAAVRSWWPLVVRKEVEWYPDRFQADAAEKAAILAERPRYNIAGAEEPNIAPPKPPRPSTRTNPRLVEIGDLATELMDAEANLSRIRGLLHAKIREAGDKSALGNEGSGPSAIARASNHRYTREYVSDLLKRGREKSDASPRK